MQAKDNMDVVADKRFPKFTFRVICNSEWRCLIKGTVQ